MVDQGFLPRVIRPRMQLNILSTRVSAVLFWTFTVAIALAPLPFGAVHQLSQAFFATLIFSLVFLWSITLTAAGKSAEVTVRHIAPETVCFLLVFCWIGMQTLPNVPRLESHPLWLEAQTTLGEATVGSFALARGAAFECLLRLGMYAAVFWLALQFGRDKRRAHQLLTTMAFAGTLYALYGLVIHLGGFEHVLWTERAVTHRDLSATMINRNNYATLAGLGLLCSVGLYQASLLQAFDTGRVGRDRIGYLLQRAFKQGAPQLACILILLTALFLTHSRAGVTSGLAGVFSLIYLLGVAHRQKSWLTRILLLCLPAGLLAVYLLSGEGWQQRLLETDFEHESRLIMYRQVWEAVQTAPWGGYGAGSFAQVFPMFADEVTSYWPKAHNDWLETLFDLGWPAAVLWFTAVSGLGLRCLIGVFRRRKDRIYSGVGFCACVLVGLHSLADFSLQIPAVAMSFALLLGVGVGQSASSRERLSS